MNKLMIAAGVKKILTGVLGPDYADDVNFIETPERVAKAYEELLRGYETAKDTSVFFEKAFPAEGYNSMIFCSNIITHSMCPHHLLPVSYVMHIAYIPNSKKGKVIGASKIPRLAVELSARAVVQEQLTNEIASAIENNLKCEGVAVVISGQHQCMQSRGVKQVGSTFETSEMRGSFRNNVSTRTEFFELLKNARR